MVMKTTLFMAMSLNGCIAKKDGNEDFLSSEHWDAFSELVTEFGNVIIGRKTFETVKKWDDEFSFDNFKDATRVIVSGAAGYTPEDGYAAVSDPTAALHLLREKGFSAALLVGGSKTAASFFAEHLIDEVVIQIEPTIIGNGIPLAPPEISDITLRLISSEKTGDIVRLRYVVL